MKVKILKPNSKKQIRVQLIFETNDELQAFGRLTNFAPLTDALAAIKGSLGDQHLWKKLDVDIHDLDGIEQGLLNCPWFLYQKTKKP